jgi:haloalkane dehalogenase
MLQPPGFSQYSVTTSLGRLVYYAPTAAPWQLDNHTDPRSTLVFLHGFGGGSSAYEWSKVYPAFAMDYRILAPDLLGWGRSDHLARDYRLDDYLVTLREFIEKVCDRPPTIIAASFTAAIVVRLAVEYPQLFKGLILCAPAGLSDFGVTYQPSLLTQLILIPVLDRLIYETGIATAISIRSFLEKQQFARANRISQEMVDAYLASAKQPRAEYSALSFIRGDLCFDLADYIADLTVPTVLFWGQQTASTSYELGQLFADMNPKAIKDLQILEDVGLAPHLEMPAVTIGIIQKFLHLLA